MVTLSENYLIFLPKLIPKSFQLKMLRRVVSAALKRQYAKVTQPAPAFSGQAVVNGAFQEISLESFNNDVSATFVNPPFFSGL